MFEILCWLAFCQHTYQKSEWHDFSWQLNSISLFSFICLMYVQIHCFLTLAALKISLQYWFYVVLLKDYCCLCKFVLQPGLFWQEDLTGGQWRFFGRGMLFPSSVWLIFIPHSEMDVWYINLKGHVLFDRSSRAMFSKSREAATSKDSPWSRESWLLVVFVSCFIGVGEM